MLIPTRGWYAVREAAVDPNITGQQAWEYQVYKKRERVAQGGLESAEAQG